MKNIMIKSAIATAVVAATTVTTIADVKVYGRVRVAAVCTDASNTATDECSLEDRSSRFGIKASSEISDGLTAFGRYEFRVNGDTASLSTAARASGGQRLSYVGLKGGFGEVSLGTRWSPLYLHTVSYADPTNAFGGTWNNGAGYLTDFRKTDTLNYKNKFGAASVGVQVQMASGSSDNDVDEVTIGGSFKAGAATIGLAYQDTADVQSTAAIHARSKFGPVSIGGTYSTRDRDAGNDSNAIALVLGYGLGGGKDIYLNYGETYNDGAADPTQVAVEYVHNMGAGFKWFAGFSVEGDDVTGSEDTNRYGAGMRYDF